MNLLTANSTIALIFGITLATRKEIIIKVPKGLHIIAWKKEEKNTRDFLVFSLFFLVFFILVVLSKNLEGFSGVSHAQLLAEPGKARGCSTKPL